jgi:hypothetical protein
MTLQLSTAQRAEVAGFDEETSENDCKSLC